MIRLALVGTALVSLSGVPGLFFGRRSAAGERLAALLMLAGAVLGMVGAVGGVGGRLRLPWPVPDAALDVRLDGLSTMFLLPIFLITAAGAVYGLAYWRQSEHPENGRKLRCFYGLMAGGMALQVLATDGLTFLLGFEVMANAAFLTISTEDNDAVVRRAGLLYIVTTHAGALALFALFAIGRRLTGTWELAALARTASSPGLRNAVFFLALGAFGLKSGAMPLHVWLPSAHATSPSHVSAVMSGVVIKTGIYGLVRIVSFFPSPPAWWGETVLAAGAVSGVLGVAYALGQHDLKRLLAYHSIENIGIILLGLGVALLGRSLQRPDLVALGLAGCLLHVWNHGLFKSLLFLAAGSVIHGSHERDIDRLGGLARRMPWTSAAFLTGAVAICGLPPLNGFVSELLVYLGLFRCASATPGRAWLAAAFAAPALALVGGLALACFAKAFGAVFLGEARTEEAGRAHESSRWMLAPMGVLAGCCALIGLAPLLVVPFLDRAAAAWAPETAVPSAGDVAPLGWVGIGSAALLALIAAGAALLALRVARAPAASGPTWGCGYLAPTPRLQYTASSFAESLVRMLRWALWPTAHRPEVGPVFPARGRFHSHVPDLVLDRALLPAAGWIARACGWFRWMQSGNMPVYIVYIFLTLLALFLWHLGSGQP